MQKISLHDHTPKISLHAPPENHFTRRKSVCTYTQKAFCTQKVSLNAHSENHCEREKWAKSFWTQIVSLTQIFIVSLHAHTAYHFGRRILVSMRIQKIILPTESQFERARRLYVQEVRLHAHTENHLAHRNSVWTRTEKVISDSDCQFACAHRKTFERAHRKSLVRKSQCARPRRHFFSTQTNICTQNAS